MGYPEPEKPVTGSLPQKTGITEDQLKALKAGDKILIRNKFGGDPNWYSADVTRAAFPESIAPAIHFKILDPRVSEFARSQTYIYYFSDGHHISIPE